MPTYKNNSTAIIHIKDSDGNLVPLVPRATLATVSFCDHAALGLTEISETPYFNRIITDDVLTLAEAPQAVSVSLDTVCVIFLEVTGIVTAFAQATANTPPELRDHTGDVIIQIPAGGRFNKMIVTGSGTCRMVQYK